MYFKKRLKIPYWSLGYLLYREVDGLTDEEIEMVNEFLDDKPNFVCYYDDEIEFMSYPAFGIACECVIARCVWGDWVHESQRLEERRQKHECY